MSLVVHSSAKALWTHCTVQCSTEPAAEPAVSLSLEENDGSVGGGGRTVCIKKRVLFMEAEQGREKQASSGVLMYKMRPSEAPNLSAILEGTFLTGLFVFAKQTDRGWCCFIKTREEVRQPICSH